LRIHSHLDEEGTKARARGFCKQGYSGVIRASLFDGKQWRKFMLARECQVEQRSFPNFLQRPSKAQSVMRTLGLLKGKTCVYRDGAFAVDHEIAVATAEAAPAKAAPGDAKCTVLTKKPENKPGEQGTLFQNCAPKQATVQKPRGKTSTRRRKRTLKQNPQQRELF
jgi:hypothetical protein